MNYYIAGFQVSDELYHHGVEGQKWYVRRYQNEDGSYTPLGMIHYGIGKAGKAFGSGVANAAKATGKAVKKVVGHKVDNVKKKHPWMMSDEELKAQTERTKLENAYLSEVNKKKEATTSRGQKLARNILESTATTLASKAVDAAAKKLFTEKEKPVRDLEDVLNDSKATASEIKSAYERFKNKKDLESYKSDKAMRDYKPTDDALDRVDQMSKGELDSYSAWLKSRYGNGGNGGNGDGNGKGGMIEKALNNREKSRAAQEAKEEAERQKTQERDAEIQQRGIDNIEREHREREERKAREEAFDREARRPDKLAEERIKAQTKYRFEERARNAEAKREQASDFRETVRTNAEKKRSAVAFVDNLFKEKAKDPRFGSYYSDYKNTSEYKDAVKKAKELVEQNKSITVGSLFYD